MRRTALGVLAGAILPMASAAQEPPSWADVQSIFQSHCVKCHSGFDAPMGLELGQYQTAMSGSWTGPVILEGDPEGSPLVHRITGQAQPQMPLDGPPFLSEAEIQLIVDWIAGGVKDGEPETDATELLVRSRPEPGDIVLFSDVEPIFLKNCIECHSDNSKMAALPEGLRLDSLEHILAGGDRIVALPGDPAMSELWRRVVGFGTPRMPFDGPPWLSDDDIWLVEEWIRQGAKDNEGHPAPIPAGGRVRLRGILTVPNAIDGATFERTSGTRVDKSPKEGAPAEMRGVVNPDGSVTATRLRRR